MPSDPAGSRSNISVIVLVRGHYPLLNPPTYVLITFLIKANLHNMNRGRRYYDIYMHLNEGTYVCMASTLQLYGLYAALDLTRLGIVFKTKFDPLLLFRMTFETASSKINDDRHTGNCFSVSITYKLFVHVEKCSLQMF